MKFFGWDVQLSELKIDNLRILLKFNMCLKSAIEDCCFEMAFVFW